MLSMTKSSSIITAFSLFLRVEAIFYLLDVPVTPTSSWNGYRGFNPAAKPTIVFAHVERAIIGFYADNYRWSCFTSAYHYWTNQDVTDLGGGWIAGEGKPHDALGAQYNALWSFYQDADSEGVVFRGLAAAVYLKVNNTLPAAPSSVVGCGQSFAPNPIIGLYCAVNTIYHGNIKDMDPRYSEKQVYPCTFRLCGSSNADSLLLISTAMHFRISALAIIYADSPVSRVAARKMADVVEQWVPNATLYLHSVTDFTYTGIQTDNLPTFEELVVTLIPVFDIRAWFTIIFPDGGPGLWYLVPQAHGYAGFYNQGSIVKLCIGAEWLYFGWLVGALDFIYASCQNKAVGLFGVGLQACPRCRFVWKYIENNMTNADFRALGWFGLPAWPSVIYPINPSEDGSAHFVDAPMVAMWAAHALSARDLAVGIASPDLSGSRVVSEVKVSSPGPIYWVDKLIWTESLDLFGLPFSLTQLQGCEFVFWCTRFYGMDKVGSGWDVPWWCICTNSSVSFDALIGVFMADMRELPTGLFEVANTVESLRVQYYHLTWNEAYYAHDCRGGEFKPNSIDVTELCAPCPGGYFSRTDTNFLCRPCLPGEYAATEGLSRCSQCDFGSFSDQSGTVLCELCRPGYYTGSAGLSECGQCFAGSFAVSEGASSCAGCPLGKYQADEGQVDCNGCSANMVTREAGSTTLTDCVCAAGFFRVSGGSCDACPAGMTCEVGCTEEDFPESSEMSRTYPGSKIFPRLKPGYWSSYDIPLEVYACLNIDAVVCPGGYMDSCGQRLMGLVCGSCEAAYFKVGSECTMCNDFELSGFFKALPWIIAPFAVITLHWKSRDLVHTWNGHKNSIACLIYLLLVHFQTLGTIKSFDVQFPNVMEGTAEGGSVSMNVLDMFRPQCIGVRDFQSSFVLRVIAPILVLVVFAVTFICAKLLGGSPTSSTGNRAVDWIRHKLRMDFDILVSCYGGIFFTFYISIVANCVMLFQCYRHPVPNTKQSLRSFPNIMCYESQWMQMLVVGLLALIFICLGSLTLFSFILWIAPRKFQILSFQKRWKFLVIKFQPGVWWWAPVVLMKGVAMNVTTALFQTGIIQLWWLILVLAVYFWGSGSFAPWRAGHACRLDLCMHAFILVTVYLSVRFTNVEDWSPNAVGGVMAAMFFVPAVVCVFFVANLWLQIIRPEPEALRLKRTKVICETFARAHSEEALTQAWIYLTEKDQLVLRRATQLIESELVSTDSTERPSRLRSRELKAAPPSSAQDTGPVKVGDTAIAGGVPDCLELDMGDMPVDLARDPISNLQVRGGVNA